LFETKFKFLDIRAESIEKVKFGDMLCYTAIGSFLFSPNCPSNIYFSAEICQTGRQERPAERTRRHPPKKKEIEELKTNILTVVCDGYLVA
jgi:hypothetical protein